MLLVEGKQLSNELTIPLSLLKRQNAKIALDVGTLFGKLVLQRTDLVVDS